MLTMPRELVDEVDALARRTGRKRSQLVRDALTDLLERDRLEQFEALMAEGYREMSAQHAEWTRDSELAQAEAAEGIWRWDD